MALSDLIAKILNDAKKEVASIETNTAQQIEQIENENELKITNRKKEIANNTAEKKIAMQRKVKILGEMQRRNLILQAKQESIENVLESLVESILNLPEAEYEKIIVALFEKTGQIENAVFHAAKGKENITISGMKKAKMAYKQGASKDIRGGFILISETLEIDNSIESIIKNEFRKELELKISKTLFV